MIDLTREVRFALASAGADSRFTDSLDKPVYNSWAGWPALTGLIAHCSLRVTVRGELDPDSNYLCDIGWIDSIVRQQVLPTVARQPGSTHSPAAILGVTRHAIQSQLPERLELRSVSLHPSPYITFELSQDFPDMLCVTQQFEFSAAHRLHNPELSDEENRRVFGKCNHPHGHGHNYLVDVSLLVPSDSRLDFDLSQMAQVVKERVIDRLDHTFLNVDIEEFRHLNPTVENIVWIIFDWLQDSMEGGQLYRVRVYETAKTWAERIRD